MHTTFYSAEQTAMRTKWFKHIAIETVQEHLLKEVADRQDHFSTPNPQVCWFYFLNLGQKEKSLLRKPDSP